MKHIYNPTKAAYTQRPTANATGTAAASKFFMLVLLSFFLLVSGESVGQGLRTVYFNDFANDIGLTIPPATRGSINVANVTFDRVPYGVLQGRTTNGTNPGYQGTIKFPTSFELRSGYTYTIEIKAKANNQQSGSAEGRVELFRGDNNGSLGNVALGTIVVAKSAEFNSYSISFTVSEEILTGQYFSMRLSNFIANNLNNAHLYIDEFLIVESCKPAIPIAESVSTCSTTNNVRLALTATGATANEIYRWYATATSVTPITDGVSGSKNENLLTPVLTQNETSFFVTRYNGVCESAKVEVKAFRGTAEGPQVKAVNYNCSGNDVTVEVSGASSGDDYRWYDVATGGEVVSNLVTRTFPLNNTERIVYVSILKAAGCESLRTPVKLPKKNELPTTPVVTSTNVCGLGQAILTASGATAGEDYLWYTNVSGGTAIHRGSAYNYDFVSTGTATFYVSKINSALGCESGSRTVVTVTALTPTTVTGDILPVGTIDVSQPVTFSIPTNIVATSYFWSIRRSSTGQYETVGTTTVNNITLSNLPVDFNEVKVDILIANGCYGSVANPYTAGDLYTITSAAITPLPVELMFFQVQAQTKGVNLTWATASELENKGFEVQVSNNGRDFKEIGFVESRVGTTSLRQDYNFLDTKAVSGTRYYRLKQVDLDGTTSYSPIRAVALNEGNGTASAYPNPFDDAVIVTLKGTEARNVQVVLMDAMGKVLQQRTEETSGNSITVDMRSTTTKGMYVLHVLDNNTKHTFKLMKR